MIENLEQLYYDQLRDLYSAETQLLEAVPKMIEAATDADLKKAFEEHLHETRTQRQRLGELCERHAVSPEGEICNAMQGLIREAEKHQGETTPGPVRDAVLIASANRVEHYEIAGYGVARSFAEALGFKSDIELLEATLKEESAADETVTKIATGGLLSSGVNQAAMA